MKRTSILITLVAFSVTGCGSYQTRISPATLAPSVSQSVVRVESTGTQSSAASLPSSNLPPGAVEHVTMVLKPLSKLGSDGKLHDAFSPSEITVVAGHPVELTVTNYDQIVHGFLSADLGISTLVLTDSKGKSGQQTNIWFTPYETGSYKWQCTTPCDAESGDWAMGQNGFMQGVIRVVSPAQNP